MKMYCMYRYALTDMAIGIIQILLQREFAGWDPLKNPRHGITTIRNLKDASVFGIYNSYQQGKSDLFQGILWKVWMPIIRETITKVWQVHVCRPLIEVMKEWLPLVPKDIKNNILDQLVLPRLQTEVENWNPLTDTVPIHIWLHPWFPFLGDRLEPLHAPIRHTISKGLHNWHPSNPSAKSLLEPCKNVFKPIHMNAFVAKNILPKLRLVMQEFIIHP